MTTHSFSKIITLFIFIITINLTFAQGSNEFDPPSITPVSPEAGAMMQYGSIPLNMSAGQMSFQVPIFNIEISGGYTWPVNLNYRYAGLVLEAKPSISGLGWLLSGGGAVTREVRGLPDRHPEGIFGSSNNNYVEEIITNGNDIPYVEAIEVLNGRADTELDKYTVNVGGINFSFKIDENNNPIYLSNHNYKVNFSPPAYTWLEDVRSYSLPGYYGLEIRNFTVTDDQGIEYVFNNIDINEPKFYNTEMEGIYSEANIFGYFSSWHLTTVTFPNGKIIELEYADNEFYNYDYSASGYKNINSPQITLPGSCNSLLYDYNGYSQSNQFTLMHRKLLNKISFPTGSITMDINEIVNYGSTRSLYSKIIINNLNDEPIITYDLTHVGQRDVMTKIDKNNEFYYEFEYFYSTNLPEFYLSQFVMPTQQDYWGFYNSRSNTHMLNIPQSSINADKRPNSFATRMGAMTKIHYPTGGYSTISYEQNQVKKLYSEIEEDNYSMNRQILLKLETDNEIGAPANKSVTFDYTFDHTVVAYVSNYLEINEFNGWIDLEITNNCSPTQFYDSAAESLRSPENPIPEICVWMLDSFEPAGQGGTYPITQSNNSGGYIKIMPGDYTFTINAYFNNSTDSKGEIKIQFYEPDEVEPGEDPYVNASIGGIRVRSINHVDNNGASTNKHYNYNDDSGLSTGEELVKAQQENTVEMLLDCYIEGISNDPIFDINYRYFYTRKNYSSKAYNPVNLNAGVPVYYKEVKEFSRYIPSSNSGGGIIIIGGPITLRAPYPGESEFPTETNPDGSLIFTVLGGGTGGTSTEELYTNGYTLYKFTLPSYNFLQMSYPFTPMGNDLSTGRASNVNLYAFNQIDDSYSLRRSQYNQYLSKIVSPYYENHPHNIKFAQKRIYSNQLRLGSSSLNDQSGGMQKPQVNGSNNDDYFIMKQYRESDISFVNSQTTTSLKLPDEREIVTTTQNTFDSYFNLKETTTTNSDNELIKSKFYYPYDPETSYPNMVTANHLTKVLKIESYNGTNLINVKDNIYTYINGDYKIDNIKTIKGVTTDPYDRIHFSYYSNGNIKSTYTSLNTATSHGNPNQNVVTYIWGYNEQYPIAKIENVEYSVISSLISSLQSFSNQDDDRTLFYNGKEGDLRGALDNFRNHALLSNARVTTYTYDPFIGVTSITDPRGKSSYFNYDDRYRLLSIKDEDGNMLSENEYNIVNQN